jgi:hypothetical protein
MFNQIIGDLKKVYVKFEDEDEDKALMLLNSLPTFSTYENLVTTLTWGKATLELKDVTRALLACLGDDVMYHVMDEESLTAVWLKMESRYMSKSLTNKLYLKQQLYDLKMAEGSDLSQHINVFN